MRRVFEGLGPVLKSRRDELGLSQSRAAAMADISRHTLVRIESDRYSLTVGTLDKLMNTLELDLPELSRLLEQRRSPPTMQVLVSAEVDQEEILSKLASALDGLAALGADLRRLKTQPSKDGK